MLNKAAEKTNTSPWYSMFQKGVVKGFPIMLGYLPVALTYGVLAKQAGMNLTEITLMSVLVFAGASQFMAAGMIGMGTGAIEIITATFVLNFRHFIMSLSFMNRVKDQPLKTKVPLSLGLTDETFTVASLHSNEAKKEKGMFFYAAIMLTAYAAWVGGSLAGGLLGDVIPQALSQSMGVALYAMFIGLLVPSVKKEFQVGLIAIVAMLVSFIFSQFISDGWAIVLGTITGGLSGIFLLKGEEAS